MRRKSREIITVFTVVKKAELDKLDTLKKKRSLQCSQLLKRELGVEKMRPQHLATPSILTTERITKIKVYKQTIQTIQTFIKGVKSLQRVKMFHRI